MSDESRLWEESLWTLGTDLKGSRPGSGRYRSLAIKRGLDLVGAATLLLVLAPFALVVVPIMRIGTGKGVLFAQERPGRGEVPFRMLKFRTMTEESDARGTLLPDAQRLTRLGLLLRATSLDELPQLINVLVGDMSFVGPRPLLLQYLPYFGERERLRFSMRPGITGWAQVNGRNTVAWDDRLALDVWYVEHWSLRLDLRIAVRTAGTILRLRGFRRDPGAAMANLDVERSRVGSEGH